MTAEHEASGGAGADETRTADEFDAPDPIDLGDALGVNPNADVDPEAAVAALGAVPWEPGAAKPDPILVCDRVSRRFGGLLAVDVDHLEIQRGVITALIGPNGAGKTTFFNLLTNFDKPDTGSRIFFPTPADAEDGSDSVNEPAEQVAASEGSGGGNNVGRAALLGLVFVIALPPILFGFGWISKLLGVESTTFGGLWLIVFATLAAVSVVAGPLAYLGWLKTVMSQSRRSRRTTRRSGPINLNGVPTYKVAEMGMVRTFQLTKALSRMTCIENMKLGATGQAGEALSASWLPFSWQAQENEIERRADALLQRFKMDHMRNEFAGTLSGGQRKLLEMARALMVEPKLVMLDEPMAGVNPALTQSLLGHITGLRDSGMTVVFVEHDMDMVQSIADWVVVMAEGRIIAEGPPASIAANQAVVDAYLGSSHDSALDLDKEL